MISRLVLLPLLLLPGCRSVPDAGSETPNPSVLAVLETDGQAPVVVSLVAPDGFHEPEADRSRMREELARLQDEVLAALDPEDFHLRRRFEAVPALSGILHSERGLRVLSSHPHVVRVDLDPGGTGGGGPPRTHPEPLESR